MGLEVAPKKLFGTVGYVAMAAADFTIHNIHNSEFTIL